jgi:hypothetical protein
MTANSVQCTGCLHAVSLLQIVVVYIRQLKRYGTVPYRMHEVCIYQQNTQYCKCISRLPRHQDQQRWEGGKTDKVHHGNLTL